MTKTSKIFMSMVLLFTLNNVGFSEQLDPADGILEASSILGDDCCDPASSCCPPEGCPTEGCPDGECCPDGACPDDEGSESQAEAA